MSCEEKLEQTSKYVIQLEQRLMHIEARMVGSFDKAVLQQWSRGR